MPHLQALLSQQRKKTNPWVLLLLLVTCFPVFGSPDKDTWLKDLGSDSDSVVLETLDKISQSGSDEFGPVLDAFRTGSYFSYDEGIYYNLGTYENDDLDEFVQPGDPWDQTPLQVKDYPKGPEGASLIPIEEIEMIEPGRKLRKAIAKSKMILFLFSKDEKRQIAAIEKMAFSNGSIEYLEQLELLQSDENSKKVRRTAKESWSLILMREGDFEQQKTGSALLGEIQSLRAIDLLEDFIENPDISVDDKKIFQGALDSILWHQLMVDVFNMLKSGLSSGSILILMALGLSITFGMMGIINMAHGEMMMVGAYTTYCIQLLFGHTSNEPNNIYFLFALPASFVASMLMGGLIELLVVRKLYKHPLESLLATYGIGLILIQITRILFGDNCPSNSPTWLQGGVELFPDMVLQYNRVFIFFLTAICLGIIISIFNYTSLGLKMKASMQNRDMAAAMGINTRQVDVFTFMLGSGMAGIAGNALITVGGITPDMGKNYIVDSFLVVVTGGVGNVVGVVCSGMGLGLINKTLESFFFGAVWSKIIVLVVVIVFIQFRPSGIFAHKGRHADD